MLPINVFNGGFKTLPVDYWSKRQADMYYERLIENCEQIAEKPDIGKNYERIVKRLFGLSAGTTRLTAWLL